MKKQRIRKAIIITVTITILLEFIASVILVFYALKSYEGMESIPDAPRIVSDEVKAITERNINNITEHNSVL